MSQTFKIVNGQIDIDASTGQVNMVTGNRKAAQDMAAALLQDYLTDNDSGSYLRAVATNQITGAGDLFIRYYIADAVQRLQTLQQKDQYLDAAEQITGIGALDLADDGNGTVVFFVSATTADGGASFAAASQTTQAATQLNQQYEVF